MLSDKAGRYVESEAGNMLKLVSFLCLLAVPLAASHEVPRLDGRIVGGSSTSISEYPYQISLQYEGSHICGGSIISSHWVLTAAQCMVFSTSGYTVRVGTSTRNSGGTVYSVSSVVRHASYNSRTYDYDIAVIRISGSFSFGTNVKTISLACNTAPASGASAVVTGWGTTTEGGSAANTLQYVTVPIVSNSACNSYYGSGSITARMVCAGYTAGGRDFCQGDVGSPLVSGGVQVGIASWGFGCARPNYPGVYTNVTNLCSWINSNTGV